MVASCIGGTFSPDVLPCRESPRATFQEYIGALDARVQQYNASGALVFAVPTGARDGGAARLTLRCKPELHNIHSMRATNGTAGGGGLPSFGHFFFSGLGVARASDAPVPSR